MNSEGTAGHTRLTERTPDVQIDDLTGETQPMKKLTALLCALCVLCFAALALAETTSEATQKSK